MKYNKQGEELPDPKPVALPVGFVRPPTLAEQIARYMRAANQHARLEGRESFEEADDFDIPDDKIDPTTPYEEGFDPLAPGVAAREAEIRSGFVEDVPVDQKEKSREVMKKVEDHVKGRRAKPAASKGHIEEAPRKGKRKVENDDEDLED